MTADREALKAAVLKMLKDCIPLDPDGYITAHTAPIGEHSTVKPEHVADAIVDAVIAADNSKQEWAYRYPNGHVATWIPELMTEDLARHVVAEHPDLLTVVRRRVTEWERVTDGD